MTLSRRDAMAAATLGGMALAVPCLATGGQATPDWRRGKDNQRIADLGDGRFRNPVMAGDHPDPTILKDGDDYYMTFSTFDAYPGLLIWHSRDLVNWQPVGPALTRPIGSVWAPELCKHDGRYFLYIPTKNPTTNWVIHADRIEGPWSDPIDLKLPHHIDPGHAVGEDGSRWLFLSGGDRIRLRADGLATVGNVEHVYDPWRYPDTWDVEGFSPEGPKITRRGGWFYLITAVGGTAGPPTGHMVIAARSRSIHGPWEHHPANPLVRTVSSAEQWWSRGHATLVEAPDGQWWSVYHGYEKDYWTLGRQTLLDPVAWTADGWFRMTGGDLSQPMPKPGGGRAVSHGMALSDDFSTLALGTRWNFFKPRPDEATRLRVAGKTLHLRGAGTAPRDGSPLLLVAGDRRYRFECRITLPPGGVAGLLLFYDQQLYCGLGFDGERFVTHQYGQERGRPANPYGRSLRMRVTNDGHIVSYHLSGDDGATWKRFDRGMEVSGYHHNVRGGFLMLRPGLYAAGEGETQFSDFRYTAL
ncbi:family 43 glycosylhydrolase [Sphingobium algorifonticola]|uniref:Xylan 1,4-beta-xylosidase n=1 Tax=Sphingobium algorifonticola TaxID=2008318 RepID=A0A437JCF4_9SPHN|nr:family 43 glycosylhydrolase [Sphingobium algorifonticola]RVT43567.1 xylan 1,4-beta-xylosidase [Sphingobium algorifonticola]